MDTLAAGQLAISVLSSSSSRALPELATELALVSGVKKIDILLPRLCDLTPNIDPGKRAAYYLADETEFQSLKQQLSAELATLDIKIPAIATFFPAISSIDESARRQAVHAVINCFRLAKDLSQFIPLPIVEIVCGTVVEVTPHAVQVIHVHRKVERLILSLTEIVDAVSQELDNFAIALELEPGEIYLLNDLARMRRIFARCNTPQLSKHVGLNFDIAHMRIAGVSAEELVEFLPRFCHAHISDHPGIHTHDQFVGSWTNVEQMNGGYVDYLRLLNQRAQTPGPIPFSGCVAIELEGCNRIMTIHDSITRLKHAIHLSLSRRGQPIP